MQNTHHPPVRNHLSHTAQGAVLCVTGVVSPLPPSARSCPLPSVRPWKENGGSGVALSPITKHLLHLGSCLSLRRVSVTGCPRKDCIEGRLLLAVCYGASGILPNCPRLSSQPIEHQGDYFLARVRYNTRPCLMYLTLSFRDLAFLESYEAFRPSAHFESRMEGENGRAV